MAYIDNLSAFWNLENENDSHGANHLTNTNTVIFVSGKVGNAGDFELANVESLSIADNAALSVANVDFFMAAIVNPESITAAGGDANTIIAKGTDSGTGEYYLVINPSSQFEFQVWSSAGFASGQTVVASTFGTVPTSTWSAVMAWHDAALDTINISINDGAINSAALTTGCHDGGGVFMLGAGYPHDTPGQFWDGLIDGALFAKRVWSAAERTFLYNGGNWRAYADLLVTDNVYQAQQGVIMQAVKRGAFF